ARAKAAHHRAIVLAGGQRRDGVAGAAIAIGGRMQTACRHPDPADDDLARAVVETADAAGKIAHEPDLPRRQRHLAQVAVLVTRGPAGKVFACHGLARLAKQRRGGGCRGGEEKGDGRPWSHADASRGAPRGAIRPTAHSMTALATTKAATPTPSCHHVGECATKPVSRYNNLA